MQEEGWGNFYHEVSFIFKGSSGVLIWILSTYLEEGQGVKPKKMIICISFALGYLFDQW